ncbi:MAG: hypothetical protein Q8R48_04720 [Candidatus Omnitrophota bacterium]|nr:hypothetical protein [Candidatus Omnitrophota bacterium]
MIFSIINLAFSQANSAFAEFSPYRWTVEEVASGVNPSAAIDENGTIHICYGQDYHAATTYTSIYYARKEENSWHITGVASKPNPCAETSIFIGTDGNVQIAFATKWGQGVWYVAKEGDKWIESQIQGPWTGNYESVAVDDYGIPHVCYWNNVLEPKGLQINYRFKNDGAWQPAQGLGIIDIRMYGMYTAAATIAVTHGPSPLPHIMTEQKFGGVRHYYKGATGWQFEKLDKNFTMLEDPNGIAQFDKRNVLYCALSGNAHDQTYLFIARRSNGIWMYEKIKKIDINKRIRVSLAIDSRDRLHVAVFEEPHLYYGVKDGLRWFFQKIPAVYYEDKLDSLSLCLDKSDVPRIVYSVSGPQKIYYMEAHLP